LLNNELEGIWKETTVALFDELSRHLLGGSVEITKYLSNNSPVLSRDFNPGLPEHEAEGNVRFHSPAWFTFHS
jgi:hypothetical protein